MPAPLRLALLAGALLTACGGNVVVDVDAGAGAGQSTGPASGSSSSSGVGGATPCRAADGVRLCGGADQQCPALNPPVCPGFGCTPALDVDTFADEPAGVCWSDLPGGGLTPCIACADGQVCVQRARDELFCTDPAVCQALYGLGATTACRYADKAAFDDEPLPDAPDACPVVAGSNALCGGGCGACGPIGYICTGRSPAHPLGVCAETLPNTGTQGSVPAASCQPGSLDMNEQCFGSSVPYSIRLRQTVRRRVSLDSAWTPPRVGSQPRTFPAA